jgi:hypothetical protein
VSPNGFRTRDDVKAGAGRDPPCAFFPSFDALADEDIHGNAAVLRLALLAFIVRQRVDRLAKQGQGGSLRKVSPRTGVLASLI